MSKKIRRRQALKLAGIGCLGAGAVSNGSASYFQDDHTVALRGGPDEEITADQIIQSRRSVAEQYATNNDVLEPVVVHDPRRNDDPVYAYNFSIADQGHPVEQVFQPGISDDVSGQSTNEITVDEHRIHNIADNMLEEDECEDDTVETITTDEPDETFSEWDRVGCVNIAKTLIPPRDWSFAGNAAELSVKHKFYNDPDNDRVFGLKSRTNIEAAYNQCNDEYIENDNFCSAVGTDNTWRTKRGKIVHDWTPGADEGHLDHWPRNEVPSGEMTQTVGLSASSSDISVGYEHSHTNPDAALVDSSSQNNDLTICEARVNSPDAHVAKYNYSFEPSSLFRVDDTSRIQCRTNPDTRLVDTIAEVRVGVKNDTLTQYLPIGDDAWAEDIELTFTNPMSFSASCWSLRSS